jgi:hypothetical protein
MSLPETPRLLRLRGSLSPDSLVKHESIRPPDLPLQLLHSNHPIGPEVLAAIQEKQHPRHAEHTQLTGQLSALFSLHPVQLNPRKLLLHQRLHPWPQRFTYPTGVIVKIQHKGGVGGEEGLEGLEGHGSGFLIFDLSISY